MKALFVLFFFVPCLAFTQSNGNCQPLHSFWSAGASVSFPQHLGTAVGFKLARQTRVLTDGVYAGGSLEAMRVQELNAWYVPVSLNVVIMPLDKAVGPVINLSPGYGIYTRKSAMGEKMENSSGGFTFYGGAGLTLSNAMITAGYAQYNFHNGSQQRTAGGAAFKMAIIL